MDSHHGTDIEQPPADDATDETPQACVAETVATASTAELMEAASGWTWSEHAAALEAVSPERAQRGVHCWRPVRRPAP